MSELSKTEAKIYELMCREPSLRWSAIDFAPIAYPSRAARPPSWERNMVQVMRRLIRRTAGRQCRVVMVPGTGIKGAPALYTIHLQGEKEEVDADH